MLLRPRTLTPASLAARRANALKSTGPRTPKGKARVALNPLKHGRSAVNLPEKLARAGCRQDEAEWRAIRARLARVFEPTFSTSEPEDTLTKHDQTGEPTKYHQAVGPYPNQANLEKKMDRLANWVWCSHRNWQQQIGAKLKSPLNSGKNGTRLSQGSKSSQRRIHNPWARLGLVFYTQLRRGWAERLMMKLILNRLQPDAKLEPVQRGEIEPPMESGLRSRVHPLARPRFWERIRYCLDPEENYHPEWQGRFRQYRRELRNSPMAMWREPHPVLAQLRRQQSEPGAR